ncbi:hypothetical protein HDU76_009037, partial [Blyttiomyces sp. JEL0837]
VETCEPALRTALKNVDASFEDANKAEKETVAERDVGQTVSDEPVRQEWTTSGSAKRKARLLNDQVKMLRLAQDCLIHDEEMAAQFRYNQHNDDAPDITTVRRRRELLSEVRKRLKKLDENARDSKQVKSGKASYQDGNTGKGGKGGSGVNRGFHGGGGYDGNKYGRGGQGSVKHVQGSQSRRSADGYSEDGIVVLNENIDVRDLYRSQPEHGKNGKWGQQQSKARKGNNKRMLSITGSGRIAAVSAAAVDSQSAPIHARVVGIACARGQQRKKSNAFAFLVPSLIKSTSAGHRRNFSSPSASRSPPSIPISRSSPCISSMRSPATIHTNGSSCEQKRHFAALAITTSDTTNAPRRIPTPTFGHSPTNKHQQRFFASSSRSSYQDLDNDVDDEDESNTKNKIVLWSDKVQDVTDSDGNSWGRQVEYLPTAEQLAMRPNRRPITMNPLNELEPSVELLHEYFRRQDPRKAWRVYKSLYRVAQRKSSPSQTLAALHPDDHTTMMGFFTRSVRPALAAFHAHRVATDLVSSGHHLDVRDYNILMVCHLRNGDLRQVQEVFNVLKGDVPLSALIPEARRLEGKQSESEHAYRGGPSLRSYQILLAAYTKAGNTEGAKAAFEDMVTTLPASFADPDAHALLIEAYGTASDLAGVDAAIKAFDKASGGVPDRRVQDAIVRALGLCGEKTRAMKAFWDGYEERLLHWGLVSFDAAITALECDGDLDGALKVWEKMEEMISAKGAVDADKWVAAAAAAHADSSSSSDPRRGSTKHHQRGGDLLLLKSGNRNVPLASSYKTMMKLHMSRGLTTEVQQLFEQMDKVHLHDRDSYSIVVKALLQAGESEKACETYDRMVGLGLIPKIDLVEAVARAREALKYS